MVSAFRETFYGLWNRTFYHHRARISKEDHTVCCCWHWPYANKGKFWHFPMEESGKGCRIVTVLAYGRGSPVAKFLVPDWGGYSRLWHRVVVPACQTTLPGRYDNSMPELTICPQSGTKNLTSFPTTSKSRIVFNYSRSIPDFFWITKVIFNFTYGVFKLHSGDKFLRLQCYF